MKNTFEKIIKLSDSRIEEFEKNKQEHELFYKWPETYVEAVKIEGQEAFDEIRKDNSVHLEDELWDIFWTYACLLQSLEKRWYIESVENVFKRCDKKFGERIPFVRENTYDWAWEVIKKKQKKELKEEHEEKYNQ